MMPLVVVFIFIVYTYMDGSKVVPKNNPKQKDITIVNINKGIECINLYFVKLFYMINS
jgi:hypothetical protein